METTIVKNTSKMSLLGYGLLFSILGILLIAFSETFIQIIEITLFVALLIVGLSAIWTYIKEQKTNTGKWYILAAGIFAVVLGTCILIFPNLLAILLGIAIGLWMLIRSIQLLSLAITAKKFGYPEWLWFLLVALLVAIFAVIIVRYPEITMNVMVIIIGVVSVLIGAYYFLLFSKVRK